MYQPIENKADELTLQDYAYSRLLSYIKMEMPAYIIGGHHKLIASYLQKLEKGEITRLAIFMPPRHGKTMLASEFFGAWYLGRNPTHEIIFSSYAQDRSDDVGKAVRNLMLSETFENIFPDAKLKTDAKGTRKFQTRQGGSFFSTGWGGAITGRGANCFPSGTLVETEIGKMAIEQLHAMENPPRVLSIDNLGQLCYASIECSRKIKGRPLYEAKTANGKTLRATADHRFYSRTRGFIEFKDFKIGEELVCRPPKVQSRQTLDFEMCPVQQAVYSSKCRCSEIHSQRICGCLLLSRLFSQRSCNQKQQTLRDVWCSCSQKRRKQKDWTTLLQSMLAVETTCSKTSQKTMSGVRPMVLAERNQDSILQPDVCQCCPFQADDWKREFSLQRRFELCKMVSGNEANCNGTRCPQMCCVRNRRTIETCTKRSWGNENKSDYSPFGRKSKEQSDQKLSNTLLPLSHCSSQIEPDAISMVARLCDRNVEVYDLQIKGTRNFFAGDVLVHNCLILDDLIKDRADAQSETNRRKREDWFSSTAYTRLMSDEATAEGRILLIMTRWAYNDIAAFLLNELAHERWHILNCPAVAEEKDIIGREPGDALWPEKYPGTRLKTIKQSVKAEDWSALYQQRPLPKEGGLVKLDWFSSYDPHLLRLIEQKSIKGLELPEELQWFHKIILSVDTAYKPNQINDPSALTVWGHGAHREYLLESCSERLEFPQLKNWILRFHEKYKAWGMGAVPVLIEDAASGQSLIQVLRQETRIPVIAIRPDKSKIIRMEHASDFIESGRVHLPERAPWLTDLTTELAQFPYGPHDDQCDSLSQYIRWVWRPKKRKSRKKMFFK